MTSVVLQGAKQLIAERVNSRSLGCAPVLGMTTKIWADGWARGDEL